ncbi:MAG: hypothetical protein LBQ80_02040 [Clostridium sp.]|jgi:hypothetical protein|nr:hypothetical protein [Clostridium sp.]
MEALTREQLPQTEQEKNAVREKFGNPKKIVVCPRCGEELTHYKAGNSEAVECATHGCLFSAIRGI